MTTEEPTSVPPPGWYADPHGERPLRWWDGTAWTDRTSWGGPPQVGVTPRAWWVWITCVLSLFTFSIWSEDSTGRHGTVIPVGLGFMVVCWVLVAKARRGCRARGISLPTHYVVAQWLSLAFGIVSLLNAILQTR
jgi:hypothetical protein